DCLAHAPAPFPAHVLFFFSSRRRHTRFSRDWSSDVCSSDLKFLSRLYSIMTKLFVSGLYVSVSIRKLPILNSELTNFSPKITSRFCSVNVWISFSSLKGCSLMGERRFVVLMEKSMLTYDS